MIQDFQLAMMVNTLNMFLESTPENPISSQNLQNLQKHASKNVLKLT